MKAIYCEVGKNCVVKDINNTIEELQSLVDGYIEICYPPELKDLTSTIAIVCNEEGKLLDLPENRVIFNKFVICGNFLIVAVDIHSGDFIDIPDNLIEKLSDYFDNGKILYL